MPPIFHIHSNSSLSAALRFRPLAEQSLRLWRPMRCIREMRYQWYQRWKHLEYIGGLNWYSQIFSIDSYNSKWNVETQQFLKIS